MGLLKSLNISSGFDIVEQLVPFTVVEKRYDPPSQLVSNNSINEVGSPSQEIRYKDCIISDVPLNYDINGDWLILQNLTIQVGRIEEKK